MKKLLTAIFVAVAAIVAIVLMNRNDAAYQYDSGFIFGTSYNVTYKCHDNLKAEIESLLAGIDASLSPFNDTSVITHVNRNETVRLDRYFVDVFTLASTVYEDTEGAFDITVAPLVNAWGFGFKSGKHPDSNSVDSIMQFVGFDKVGIADGKVEKKDPRVMLDCSAIAKGYGVDVVADFLKSKGIEDFMVEIGGEVVTAGESPKGSLWRIGVSRPDDDSLNVNKELQGILRLTDKAMATSGNYRNFYYRNGKKYAHTIDPKNGWPIQHSLLSATVLTDQCAKADAYATAFMVMGVEKAKTLLRRHPDLMAYLIYSDDNGQMKVWYSPSLKANVELK